jgi:general secretion pathway protein A
MYTAFYNLEKKPFTMTPDPSFLYMTSQHREALTGLTYAVLDRKGFLVLSGMAGVGKTTALAWVLQKLPTDKVRSSVILNPTLTCQEFLELTLLDFGITDVPASKAQRLWLLQKFLMRGREEGKVNVLIVDEAHKLSFEVLEEIRLLGNLEYGDEKLIQILLLGQRELDDVLNQPNLWQLKQRISVRLTLNALSTDDVDRYVQHRWTVAGGKTHPFTPEAVAHLKKWSKGIPRLINSICDNALILAFADESSTVTVEHVDSAAKDLQLIEKPVAPPPAPAPSAVLAAAPAVAAAAAAKGMTAVAESPVETAAPVMAVNGHKVMGSATVAKESIPRQELQPVNGHKTAVAPARQEKQSVNGKGTTAPAASVGSGLKMLEEYPTARRGFWLRLLDKLGLSYNGAPDRSNHPVAGKKK